MKRLLFLALLFLPSCSDSSVRMDYNSQNKTKVATVYSHTYHIDNELAEKIYQIEKDGFTVKDIKYSYSYGKQTALIIYGR